jgi:hypothetical protein
MSSLRIANSQLNYTPIGSAALTGTVSTTTITLATNASYGANANFQAGAAIYFLQPTTDAIYLSLNGDAAPSATTALLIPVNTIVELSAAEFNRATMKRVTNDATVTIQQLQIA